NAANVHVHRLEQQRWECGTDAGRKWMPFLVAASSQGWQFFGSALDNSRWFTQTDTPNSVPVQLIPGTAFICARQASECAKAHEVTADAALAHSVVTVGPPIRWRQGPTPQSKHPHATHPP